MTVVERRQVRGICEHVLAVAQRAKGAPKKEVLHQSAVRLRALLRKGRFRQAEALAYGMLMESKDLSKEESSDEAAEDHKTSKTPHESVGNTVNIGRSIKFIRVAAEIKQSEMAQRLEISQNYLSLLENNKADPSLSLLRRISSEFNVPVNFLLLEGSFEYESKDVETDSLLKQLEKLIHQLQTSRIKGAMGALDGTGSSGS